jgi:hypothetical protein
LRQQLTYHRNSQQLADAGFLLAVLRELRLVGREPVIYVNINMQEQLVEATLVSGVMGHGNPTIPFLQPSYLIANDVIRFFFEP